MNRSDRGILVGMVLGDGYIQVRSRLQSGKYRYESSAIRMKHSIKQAAYARHKAEILRRMFGGVCTANPATVMADGKQYAQVYVEKSNVYFKHLHRLLYPSGQKLITRRALDYLTPHGIAVWYMDDGNCNVNRNKDGWVTSCTTIISTCCTEEEALTVQAWFRAAHDLEVKVFPVKGGLFSIRMNTGESQKFARLVEQFVIPEMKYKLAHVANLNFQECRPTAMKCVVCGNTIYETRRKMMCVRCYTRQNG